LGITPNIKKQKNMKHIPNFQDYTAKLNEAKKVWINKDGQLVSVVLKKGDKVKTRDGNIETVAKINSNGNVETEESDYTWSTQNLELLDESYVGDLKDQIAEKIVRQIVKSLVNAHDRMAYVLGIETSDDVYEDLTKQKKYINMVNTEIAKLNLEEKIAEFADTIHDELEDSNYHILNSFLAASGYYGVKYKEEYLKMLKKPNYTGFAVHLI
jgi:hypothetical protein